MLKKVTENIELAVVTYSGGMGATNCYLLKGEDGYTVIDTGMNSKQAIRLWEGILETGYKIEKVVLTHVHQDHIGLAKWFQQEKGVPIIVSHLSYREMKKFHDPQLNKRMKNLVMSHGVPFFPDMPDTSFLYDFEPDGFFDAGDEILLGKDKYEVIWTPGHAYDHYCFYNREKKIMILGDHVLKQVSPVIGLWAGEEKDLLNYYFDSLKKLDAYPTNIALPGHGEMIYDLQGRVEEIQNSHQKRLQQVYQSVETNAKTALEVCLDVYGLLSLEKMVSPFMASLTRLIYLEKNKEIERIEENNVFKFKAVKK